MKSIQTVACICLFSACAFGQTESDLLAKYEKDLKANPRSSITHFRIGEIYLQQGVYQSAANAFQEALNGDLEAKWVEVWSHVNLGKIFDLTNQRERAENEYTQAQRTKDNTRGAMDEAAIYMQFPYPQKMHSSAQPK
jgi:tetratricopeptide (TPR) repeat protein